MVWLQVTNDFELQTRDPKLYTDLVGDRNFV